MSVVFPAAFGPVMMSFLSSVMSFFTIGALLLPLLPLPLSPVSEPGVVVVFKKYASFIVVVAAEAAPDDADADANLHGFSAPESMCSIIPARCS